MCEIESESEKVRRGTGEQPLKSLLALKNLLHILSDSSHQQLCQSLSIRPIRRSCWRRQWHPTPVLLPGKSHGRKSLVGCGPWGLKESDTTE